MIGWLLWTALMFWCLGWLRGYWQGRGHVPTQEEMNRRAGLLGRGWFRHHAAPGDLWGYARRRSPKQLPAPESEGDRDA